MVISSLGAELEARVDAAKARHLLHRAVPSAEKVLARVALVSTQPLSQSLRSNSTPGDGLIGPRARVHRAVLHLVAFAGDDGVDVEVPLVIGLPLQAEVGADAAALTLEETVARQPAHQRVVDLLDAGARVERSSMARSICLPGTSSERANSGNALKAKPEGTVSGVDCEPAPVLLGLSLALAWKALSW